jgi:hypothetical protein
MPPVNSETWHGEFNPHKFLKSVSLEKLIERNAVYNESLVEDSNSPCILCGQASPRGIYLNDNAFLCESCFSQVRLITYPEKYERLHREHLVECEAHRLAWEAFRAKYEQKPKDNVLIVAGWLSGLLVFVNVQFLILTGLLLIIGYALKFANRARVRVWLSQKSVWEAANPAPQQPILKHFHDPTAELSVRDRAVMRIFDHWPGYPPFWKYLRLVVLARDDNRCQVSGCPSRLELHVHHRQPVAEGGAHIPDNLVSLCDFHHALEPEKGHDRIWGEIKTRYFTLIQTHERSNRATAGTHCVRAHLRRLRLITDAELERLATTYGFACPVCQDNKLTLDVLNDKNLVRIACPTCNKEIQGPQELTEETGPKLAEILTVSRHRGSWHARWDMLEERKSAHWGTWSRRSASARRRAAHKANVASQRAAPVCPKCGAPMRLIKPRPQDTWKTFWGCTQFQRTGCKGSATHFD